MVALQLGEVLNLSVPVLLLLAGTGLIVAEALAPGAHFIVLGVALFVAGLVGLLAGSTPLGLFLMALSVVVAGAATFYAYREFDVYGGSSAGRTSDSDSLQGKFGTVTERVTPADGEVKLDSGGFSPHYRARSMDGEIAVGTEVMVIDPGGGNVVTVEPVTAVEDSIDRQLERDRQQSREDESGDAETETDTA